MRSLLLAAAVLLAGGQEPADESPEESPEAVLAELTELVEGFDEFALRYTLFSQGEVAMELDLAYRAPDRAVLRMETPQGSSTTWIVAGTWGMQLESPDGILFSEVDVDAVLAQHRDVRRALHEAFGGDEPFRDDPLPILHVHPGARDAEDNPSFDINFAFETRRVAFFCWNGPHGKRYEQVTLEPGHVVLHAPGDKNVLEIARDESAGFLELAYGEGKQGPVSLRLDSVELEVDDERIEIPERPEGADELPEAMLAGFQMLGSPSYARRSIYAVARELESGRREWDDDAPDRLAEVLETLHRHRLPGHYEEWMQGQSEKNRELAAWVAQALDAPDLDRADLTERVTAYETRLEEYCTQAADAYVGSLKPPADDEWNATFLELEHQVARDLFAETVTGPILAEFETEVRGQL